MATSLVDYLQTVPDFRSDLGKRYQLDHILLMIIFGMMSGRYGYRELGTFVKANRSEFVKLLGLKRDAVPSHVTIRTVLQGIDFSALNVSFSQWASRHLKIDRDDLFSIDGKALASTITDYAGAKQDFICFLSLFSQRQGAVLSLSRYHNGHTSEIPTLQEMITALDLTGVSFSLDALHCQKKQSQPSSIPATTTL